MSQLSGRLAVVTGASRGIGLATAYALRDAGATVVRIARSLSPGTHQGFHDFPCDLVDVQAIVGAATGILNEWGTPHIVVSNAGAFLLKPFEATQPEELDHQLQVNVRAPYLLTQALLPSLIAREGQIVFINSSAGFHPAKAGWAAYSASKHALRALADGLRALVNPKGVRVISVFPGRTATPMQEEVHRFEGKPYDPERFLQPRDVAYAVLNALALPRTAEVTDLQIRPMKG